MWSQRDISLQDRINIVITLALSKLIFVGSVLETLEHFADEVNRLIFDYIWNYKPAKIRRTPLIKSKKEGGLGIKDFSFFNKALKLTWVKRLCSGINAPSKYIPTYFLANVGGIELFNCNYNTKLLNLNKHIPSFYKQVICYWQDIKLSTPENKEPVLQEIIWNNRFIKVNGKPVFYSKWRQNGIEQIKDLLDVPFEVLANKFHIERCHFLNYHSLVSAIPSEWNKRLFKNESNPTPALTSCISSKPLSCKTLHQELNLLV